MLMIYYNFQLYLLLYIWPVISVWVEVTAVLVVFNTNKTAHNLPGRVNNG